MKPNKYHKRIFVYILGQDTNSLYEIAKDYGDQNLKYYTKAAEELTHKKMIDNKGELFTLHDKLKYIKNSFVRSFLKGNKDFRIMLAEEILSSKKYTFVKWITKLLALQTKMTESLTNNLLSDTKTSRELDKLIDETVINSGLKKLF